MLKYLIIIFFFLVSQFCVSQNQILNPSFENHISCVFGSIYEATPWYPPYGSPDYFSTCMPGSLRQVPNNEFGYQSAKSGNSYIGLATYYGIGLNFREYVTGKFSKELTANATYCVEFNISLADSSNYATSRFGCVISKDSITPGGPLAPIISLTPNYVHLNIVSDTAIWTNISFNYTALGGEKFITFGLFESDLTIDTLRINNNDSTFDYSYYYIDDVSIALCELSDSLHLNLPNVFTPNGDGENDNFVIEVLGAKNLKKLSAKVYNRWGMLVNSVEFPVLSDEHTQYSTLHTQYTLWDGYTTAAAQAPQGTYYYIITYTTIDDETFTEKSYLTLFR